VRLHFVAYRIGVGTDYYLTVSNESEKTVKQPRWATIAVGLMRDKGITQRELQEVFDVTTRGAVGHYMRGRREPSVDQLLALAEKLGVTLSELVGEVPLSRNASDTEQISALLQEIDQDKLPMLLAMIEAAAARK
jgi:transcriptional regulator with XRE-family HTH domain